MILYVNRVIKEARAQVIKRHLKTIGTNKCVCFTCGNATISLRLEDIDVLSIGNFEELKPMKWFSYSDIQKYFGLFDATSGHLPLPLISKIADKIKNIYKETMESISFDELIEIPTGSGESLLIMCMAFPSHTFRPIRLDNKETEYHSEAPLNRLIMYIDNHKGTVLK